MFNALVISARIARELTTLERVVSRCTQTWADFQTTGDDRFVDAVALNLQSFYTGVEHILEFVLLETDQTVPSGSHWHQALLQLAATPVPQLRPALLAEETSRALDRFRGFRHVVRNVYAFDLDANRVAQLMELLPETFAQVRHDLSGFALTITASGRDS